MKLLLDQGTPRSAAVILRRAGFDAVHTGETVNGNQIRVHRLPVS